MGWDLSVYIEGKGKDGKWKLLANDAILTSAKYLIDWDECDENVGIDKCSSELEEKFYRSREESHNGAIKYNPGMTEYTRDMWENDKKSYNLKYLYTDTISIWISDMDKFVDYAFNAVFKASGCEFTNDDMSGVDFYADKWDGDDNIKKSWNPMTYPINKDLLYDLQEAYFKLNKLSKLRMLCNIAHDMADFWYDEEKKEYVHGETRFVVEYC